MQAVDDALLVRWISLKRSHRFEEADRLREQLRAKGIEPEDVIRAGRQQDACQQSRGSRPVSHARTAASWCKELVGSSLVSYDDLEPDEQRAIRRRVHLPNIGTLVVRRCDACSRIFGVSSAEAMFTASSGIRRKLT
jgi:hypothetical protein